MKARAALKKKDSEMELDVPGSVTKKPSLISQQLQSAPSMEI